MAKETSNGGWLHKTRGKTSNSGREAGGQGSFRKELLHELRQERPEPGDSRQGDPEEVTSCAAAATMQGDMARQEPAQPVKPCPLEAGREGLGGGHTGTLPVP